MAFPEKYFIRVVTETRTFVEVYQTSSSNVEYVLRDSDNKPKFKDEYGDALVYVTEPMRPATTTETIILSNRHTGQLTED